MSRMVKQHPIDKNTLSDWCPQIPPPEEHLTPNLRQGAVRAGQLMTFETHLEEQLVGFLRRRCTKCNPRKPEFLRANEFSESSARSW